MTKKYIIILVTLVSGCGTQESNIPINSTGTELSSRTEDAATLRKADEVEVQVSCCSKIIYFFICSIC